MSNTGKSQTTLNRMNRTNQSKGGGGMNPTPNGAISTPPPTVWSSLSDNNLATPDAYGGLSSGTFGTMTAKHLKLNAGGALGGLMGMLNGGPLAALNGVLSGLGNIGNAISQGMQFYAQLEQAAMSGGNPLERVANVLGVSASGVSSMIGTGGVLSNLMSNADQATSLVNMMSKSSDMLLRINEDVKMIRNVNFEDLNQVSGLLNHIAQRTGGTSIAFLSDVSGQALFAADVVNRMSKLGIKDVVKNVQGMFRGDLKAWHLFIDSVLPGSIKSSDIAGLHTIVDLIGGERINVAANRFTQQVSRNYEYRNVSGKGKRLNKSEEFRNVYDLFVKSNGENWAFKQSKGQYALTGQFSSQANIPNQVFDLAALVKGTSDFKDLFKQGLKNVGRDIQNLTEEEMNKKLMVMAFDTPRINVKDSIKQHFKYLLITSNQLVPNNTVYPTRV